MVIEVLVSMLIDSISSFISKNKKYAKGLFLITRFIMITFCFMLLNYGKCKSEHNSNCNEVIFNPLMLLIIALTSLFATFFLPIILERPKKDLDDKK
jgi:choline-glycine betaine transporter